MVFDLGFVGNVVDNLFYSKDEKAQNENNSQAINNQLAALNLNAETQKEWMATIEHLTPYIAGTILAIAILILILNT